MPTQRLYHRTLGMHSTILEVLILLLNVFYACAYWLAYSIKKVWLHKGLQFIWSLLISFFQCHGKYESLGLARCWDKVMLSSADCLSHSSAGSCAHWKWVVQKYEKSMWVLSEFPLSFPRLRNCDCSYQFWVLNSALLTMSEATDLPQKLFSGSLQHLPPTVPRSSGDLTSSDPASLSVPSFTGVMFWVGCSAGPVFQITLTLSFLAVGKP